MKSGLVGLIVIAVFLLCSGIGAGADFDGDSRDDVAVFRPSNGLWNIRGVTRIYFGTSQDTPCPGDFNGDGVADPAFHRPSTNLWKARNITRFYFGNNSLGETAITGGGGGQRTFDYVVKPGDGQDLVAALESDTYHSVFVPAGVYYAYSMINIDNVKRIVGEALHGNTRILLINGQYLNITSQGCSIEGIMVQSGGDSTSDIGAFYVNDTWYVTLRDCYSYSSADKGFEYTGGSHYITMINCQAEQATAEGFEGDIDVHTSRLIGCTAEDCTTGFSHCNTLVACISEDSSGYGFNNCCNLSACEAKGPSTGGVAFHNCENVSACRVYGIGGTGFYSCEKVSACSVETASFGFEGCAYISGCRTWNCTTDFPGCWKIDNDSCGSL